MAETTQGTKLSVRAPEAGQSVIVSAIPGQDIVLDSAFDQAEPKMSDNNVVFEFADGGQVVIEFSDIPDGQVPNIILADGTVLNLQEFLASLGEGDVEPAAGPEGGATGSGGVGEYRDDAGNLIDGVDKLGGLDPRDFTAITVEALEATDELNPLPSAGLAFGAADEDGLRISELTMTPFDGNDDGADGDHPAQFAYAEGGLNYDFGGDGPSATTPFVWSLAGLVTLGVESRGNALQYEVVDGGTTLNAFYITEYPNGEYDYRTESQGPVRVDVFSLQVTDLAAGTYRFELYQPLDHSVSGTEDDILYNFSFTLTDGSGDSVVGGLNMIVDDDSPVVAANASELPELILDESPVGAGEGSGIVESPQDTGNYSLATAISLDGHFTLGVNPDVADSETVPFVSIHAVGNGQPDYYAFTVTEAGSTAVFDIDYGKDHGGSFDPYIHLWNSTGVRIASDDDQGGDPGSFHSYDSYLTYTFTEPGTYYISVGQFPGSSNPDNPIPVGGTYQLQVSLTDAIMGGGDGDGIRVLSADFSGNFDFAYGADGPGIIDRVNYDLSLIEESVSSGLFALGENGEPGAEIMLGMDNGSIIGTVDGGTPFFRISVDGETGRVTFVQYENVWHAEDNDNDDSVFLDLPEGTILLTAVATDGDGDTASAFIDLSTGVFGIEDDGPTLNVEADGQASGAVAINLDETVGDDRGSDADGNNDDDGPGLAQVTTSLEGGLAALFAVDGDYGTDGPGTTTGSFSFVGFPTEGGLETTLSSTAGGVITLYLEGGMIVGRDANGGDPVLTIEIVESPADSGLYQLQTTLYEALDHGDDNNHFDSALNLLLADEGAVKLQYEVTRTDADGDSVTESAAVNLIGEATSVFSFDDDGPTLTVTAAMSETEAGQLAVNLDETVGADRGADADGNDDDASPALAQVTSAVTGGLVNLFGQLGGDYGSDGPGTTTGSFSFVGFPTEGGLETTLSSTAGGVITLYLDGGMIVGRDANGGDPVLTIEIVESPADSGLYQLQTTLYEALDHGDDNNQFDSALNLLLADEGAVKLQYEVTRTDADGDSVTESAAVNLIGEATSFFSFDDDGPSMVVNAIAESGIVLTTDDAETIGANFDTDSANFAAAMQAAVTPLYGSDGSGGTVVSGFELVINGGGELDSGLNSNGLDIMLSKDGDDVVGRTTAGEVFRISVDSNGTVGLKQSAEVDHIEGTPSDDLISLAESKIFLEAKATVTDGDDDVATRTLSVDLGGNIRFVDDVPNAENDSVSAVENWTGAKTYNLLLIVDRSGSISQAEMQAAVVAMNSLLDKYAEVASGGEAGVKVQVVTFAVDGTLVHGTPVSIADAKAYLDILDNSGGSGNTNYDAAVAAATPAINGWPAATADHDNVVYFISDGAPTVGNGTVGLTNTEEAAWETTLEGRGATAWAIGVGTGNAADDDLADMAYPDGNVLLASNFNDSLLDALIGTVPIPTTVSGNVLDNDSSGADGWNAPALVSASFGGDTYSFTSDTDSHTFDLGLVGSVLIKGDGSYVFTPAEDVQDDIFADLSYTVRDGDGDETNAILRLTTTDLSEVTAVSDTVTVIPGEDPVQWGGAEFVVVDDEGAGGQDRWDVSSDLFTADAGDVISLDLNLSNYIPRYTTGGNVRQDAVEIGLLDAAGNEVATISMKYWSSVWTVDNGSAGTVAFSYAGGTTTAHVTFNGVTLDGTYKISLNVNDGTGGSEKLTVRASGLVVGTGTDPVYWPSVGMAAMALPITGDLFANDALGAEGASVMAVAVGGLVFTDTDSDGLIVAAGQYGTVTVNTLTGAYEYTSNTTGSVPDIGDTDVFTYTVSQADGDSSTADLTINFAASVGETGTGASETLVLSADTGGSMSGLGGNDHLIGGDGNDSLYGGDGSDVLEGGLGNDLLVGGAGSDFLSGGEGNDTLVGGAGDDVMTGGAGQDVFRYMVGDLDGVIDGDTITDFELGSGGDILDLAALLNGATAGTLNQYLDFTVTNIAGGEATVEINVDPAGTGNHASTLATITVTGVGVGDTADTIIDTMINHNIDI